MSIAELSEIAAELKQSRQPLAKDKLAAIARDAGFTVRQGRKHLRCEHNVYKDISFGVSRTDDSPVARLVLAEHIAEIIRRNEQKDLEIQNAFATATENRLEKIRQKLPPYITAELTPNGRVVLRDAQVPQIGVTLYSEGEDRLVENKIHNEMEPMKKEIYILFNRLKMQYDATPVFDDNGTFTGHVKHDIYGADISMDMPAYQEGDNIASLLNGLNACIDQIVIKDMEQAMRRDALLDRPFLGTTFITHTEQRGERTNHVQVCGLGKTLTLTFHTFSNQRVAGDGSRGRITDAELDKIERDIAHIEKRLAVQSERRALRAA